MWAAQKGHVEIAKSLLDRGAESVEDDVTLFTAWLLV